MNKFGKLLQGVSPKAAESKPARERKRRAEQADAGKVGTTETREVVILRPVGKRSKDDYTQVSAYIPKGTHKKVKAALVDDGRDFSELVSDLLAEWLEEER